MANRHLARSIVMQTLFSADFSQLNTVGAQEALAYNADQFAPGIENFSFMESLLDGVLKKKSIIDEVITKAAPEWPLDKINGVDRNVLRLGLYELLFGDYDQVPPKVAINESIELAKSFGGESSGRFVNGVLGAVYKEIGEPGKEQKTKKQAEVAYEDMPIDQKAGAVVYAYDESNDLHFAMVHDVFGFWTLSKGGVEDGETAEQAVVREVKEEINADIVVEEKIGENEYIANHPERGKVRKQVHYFLARADFKPLTLEEGTGGLDGAQWFAAHEIAELRMYEDVTGLMAQAIEKLLS
ncbi:transcription antitermination factor NusB [Candidatus Nomurabacteria bacterium]|nr:transcription antitermination factor NusB [Candidatus Nomurabacteria bacterium]